MNNNLPEIRKEGVFLKIKKWFKRLFNKEEIVEETINVIDKEIEGIKDTNFKENLQVESKNKILAIQRKLKEKQIEIADLTDKELDEMIELYKSQIEEKKSRLIQYRNKMIKNKNEV